MTNPGRYGRRLAEFLAAGLRTRGFATGTPVAEDWGWVVPIANHEFKLWIGCGNMDEETDSFLCFIEPHTSTIRRWFRAISTRERIEALRDSMDAVLSETSGIRNKKWFTYEEFMRPPAGPAARAGPGR